MFKRPFLKLTLAFALCVITILAASPALLARPADEPYFEAAGKVANWPIVNGQPRLMGPLNWNSRQVGNGPLFLLYDQPVQPDKIKNELHVTDSSGSPLKFRIYRPKDARQVTGSSMDTRHLVAVVIKNLPGNGKKIRVSIPDWKDGILDPLVYTLTVNTEFKLVGQYPYNPRKDGFARLSTTWDLEFDNPFELPLLREALKVSPKPKSMDVTGSGWRQARVRVQLEPGTRYRMTIDKTFTDVLGNRLNPKVDITFDSEDLPPVLEVPSAPVLLERISTRLPVRMRNVRMVEANLYRFDSPRDFSRALSAGRKKSGREYGLKTRGRKLQMQVSATRNAATIMGVKGCSIKLLDTQRRRLRFSSTYGLSEDYVVRGSIDLEKSPINRSIIEGSYYAIGKIDQQDYFQYPEDIRKEGIASMLCLPLRVEKMVLGVFCVYSDVTHDFNDEDVEFFLLMADLTALAIENLRSELNKTWFLEKAAHQLRSPLNAIDTMLKTLRQGYLGPTQPEQAKLIARCEQRIGNLRQVIADLLDLGVKRTDLSKITMHPVNIADVVKPLVHLYQSQAAAKNLDFSCDIEEGLPNILAQEKLMDELLNNLISNAIKYTPSGGKVRIRVARESSDRVLCEVADTGIGIPADDISRLFTEFFRSANAKALTEEGTGLGLVIVKEILDRLRGTIAVSSKLDEGTCFTCFFPVIDGPQ